MNKVLNARPPSWFWLVAVLLLAWNAMGVFMYISSVTITADQLASLPPERQQLLAAMPSWAVGAFAIAVFAGLLGAIALVMRRGWARLMFIVSLLAVIVNDIWAISAGALPQMTVAELAIDTVVIVIAAFSIWFTGQGIARGWLR